MKGDVGTKDFSPYGANVPESIGEAFASHFATSVYGNTGGTSYPPANPFFDTDSPDFWPSISLYYYLLEGSRWITTGPGGDINSISIRVAADSGEIVDLPKNRK